MTNPIDPRRAFFTSRSGTGRVKQHGDGTKHVPTPPRNAPCPCGSGKKAKKCHPNGLRPIVNRIDTGGTCDGCGKQADVLVPLRHEAVNGLIGNVGPCCLSGDPKPVIDRLLAESLKVAKERTGTVIVYECEKCHETDLVDVADTAIDAGTLPPRSTHCQPCNAPRLPTAARRISSKEFGDLAAAGYAKDKATVESYMGNAHRLGKLPGVLVKTIPFAGDLVHGSAEDLHHDPPPDGVL